MFPAFCEYLEHYITHLQAAVPMEDKESVDRIAAAQAEYDVYSAEKDPAIGLLATYFGKEVS